MKLHLDKILMNILLAGISEKMLKDKQANLSGNWKTTQSLLMSLSPDPAVGMALHQSEVSREDQKVTQLRQAELRESITVINRFLNDRSIRIRIRKYYYDTVIPDLIKPYVSGPDQPPPLWGNDQDYDHHRHQLTLQERAVIARERANELKEMELAVRTDKDDLTKLIGIGEASEKLLNAHGIHCYSDFKRVGLGNIEYIFDEANMNISKTKIHTLVDQAELAEQGKWEELETHYKKSKQNNKEED